MARGTNKKSISDKRLRDLEISCPDYEEQKRVGKIVLEKFNEINSLKSKIEETSESLFELVKE